MKTVRFKSRPQKIRKKSSIYPNSRYNNRLLNILRNYSIIKSIEAKTRNEGLFQSDIFEMVKKEINNPYILNNCGLLQFPIRLTGNKFMETEYIEPCWDGETSTPFFNMISIPYIIVEQNKEDFEIIEFKRLKAFNENKPVKKYEIVIPSGFEVINED